MVSGAAALSIGGGWCGDRHPDGPDGPEGSEAPAASAGSRGHDDPGSQPLAAPRNLRLASAGASARDDPSSHGHGLHRTTTAKIGPFSRSNTCECCFTKPNMITETAILKLPSEGAPSPSKFGFAIFGEAPFGPSSPETSIATSFVISSVCARILIARPGAFKLRDSVAWYAYNP